MFLLVCNVLARLELIFFPNQTPLYNLVSRKVMSVSNISAVNFFVKRNFCLFYKILYFLYSLVFADMLVAVELKTLSKA